MKLSDSNEGPRKCVQEKQVFWGAREGIPENPTWLPEQTKSGGIQEETTDNILLLQRRLDIEELIAYLVTSLN